MQLHGRKMNFNDDIVGIAIATGIPIEWIREQLCTEVNKYAVSADDLSAAVVRGVILGYSFDTALETATAYIARGFRPCDINYIPLI